MPTLPDERVNVSTSEPAFAVYIDSFESSLDAAISVWNPLNNINLILFPPSSLAYQERSPIWSLFAGLDEFLYRCIADGELSAF